MKQASKTPFDLEKGRLFPLITANTNSGALASRSVLSGIPSTQSITSGSYMPCNKFSNVTLWFAGTDADNETFSYQVHGLIEADGGTSGSGVFCQKIAAGAVTLGSLQLGSNADFLDTSATYLADTITQTLESSAASVYEPAGDQAAYLHLNTSGYTWLLVEVTTSGGTAASCSVYATVGNLPDNAANSARIISELDEHVGAAAPHSGHESTANKDTDGGYVGRDASGNVDLSADTLSGSTDSVAGSDGTVVGCANSTAFSQGTIVECNQSFADSNGTVFGNNSHADSSGQAGGNYSHGDSYGEASGNYSHADSNGDASGNYSHADSNGDASGANAHANCSGDASADNSYASGKRASANIEYSHAVASGGFSIDGDADKIHLILRGATSDNTQTELTDPNKFTIGNEKTYGCRVVVTARQDTGANNAMYMRQVLIERTGGTVSLVGSVQTIGTDIETNSDWDIAITADDTNKTLKVAVTGDTSQNIRWTADITANRVRYSD